MSWTWLEGLRFALAEEFLLEKGLSYEMSLAEKWGSAFLRPLYRVIHYVSKHIRRPMAIVLFTMVAALSATIAFYNIPALVILGKIFPSQVFRFLFFLYVEVNLVAMGGCAFGRFNNNELVKLWKNGKLEAIFPGDKRL